MAREPHVPIEVSHVVDLGVEGVTDLATVIAKISGIPYLEDIAGLLGQMNKLCQNVKTNQEQIHLICHRCATLALVTYNGYEKEKVPTSGLDKAKDLLCQLAGQITKEMVQWARVHWCLRFLSQKQVAVAIQNKNKELDHCEKAVLQAIAEHSLELLRLADKRADERHEIQLKYIVDLKDEQVRLRLVLEHMEQLQMAISRQAGTEGYIPDAAGKLHGMQSQFHQLLPNLCLINGAEVTITGTNPTGGSVVYDIYDGVYLNKDPVEIRKLRSFRHSDVAEARFNRECKNWRRIFSEDKGKHILTFYGALTDKNGESQFAIVYAKAPNGSANKYVKLRDSEIDYLRLIHDIAIGIQVLHQMSLCHGDICGENIMINSTGRPLIGNFGLAKFIDSDDAQMSMSSTTGKARWFARELLDNNPVLTPASDVWSFGMTAYELVTHKQPYWDCKNEHGAVRQIMEGKLPTLPNDQAIAKRGLWLGSPLWELLLDCWKQDPKDRPTIGEVCERLATMRGI